MYTLLSRKVKLVACQQKAAHVQVTSLHFIWQCNF